MPEPLAKTRDLISKPGRPPKRKNKRNPVTPRVQKALTHLIEHNGSIEAACNHASISSRALRYALAKPEVLAWFRAQRQVFRTMACAGNIRTLQEIRDDPELKTTAAGQTARIKAVQVLEGEGGGEGENSGRVNVNVQVVTPGYVIDLREPVEGEHQIASLEPDASKPLIEHEDVPQTRKERGDE